MIAHKDRLFQLEKSISRKVGRAIADYGMIQDRDRILVAVSGGKDSLVLLKMLSERRRVAPIRYDIVAIHVDLGYTCANREVLKEFLSKQGFDLQIKKVDILQGRARSEISCFWCSWSRRKALFEASKEYNCNKIAFGHHKDDIVETILLNLLFKGEISAMAANQEMFSGRVSIIRPLAYCEEDVIEEFARLYGFPVPHCACPNSKTTKRAVVRKLIGEIKEICPGVKTNVFKSLTRIKKDYLL